MSFLVSFSFLKKKGKKMVQNHVRLYALSCAGQLLDTAQEQVTVCFVHCYNGVAWDAKLFKYMSTVGGGRFHKLPCTQYRTMSVRLHTKVKFQLLLLISVGAKRRKMISRALAVLGANPVHNT